MAKDTPIVETEWKEETPTVETEWVDVDVVKKKDNAELKSKNGSEKLTSSDGQSQSTSASSTAGKSTFDVSKLTNIPVLNTPKTQPLDLSRPIDKSITKKEPLLKPTQKELVTGDYIIKTDKPQPSGKAKNILGKGTPIVEQTNTVEVKENPYQVDITDKSSDNTSTGVVKQAEIQDKINTGEFDKDNPTSYLGASNQYEQKTKEIVGGDDLQSKLDYFKVIGGDDDLFNRLPDGDKQIYNNNQQLSDLYKQRDFLSNSSDAQTQDSHLKEVNKSIAEIEKTNSQLFLKRNSQIDNDILSMQKQLNDGFKIVNTSTGNGTVIGQDGLEYGGSIEQKVPLTDEEKTTLKSQITTLQKKKSDFISDNNNPKQVYQDLQPQIKMYEDKNIIPKDATPLEKLKLYYGITLTQLNALKEKSQKEGGVFTGSDGNNGVLANIAEGVGDAIGLFTNDNIANATLNNVAGYTNPFRQRLMDDKTTKSIKDLESKLDAIAPILAINKSPNTQRNSLGKTFVNSFSDALTGITKNNTSQDNAVQIQKALQDTGIELDSFKSAELDKQARGKDKQFGETNMQQIGHMAEIMLELGATSALIPFAGAEKGILSAVEFLTPKGRALLGIASNAIQETKIGKVLYDAAREGIKMQTMGTVNKQLEDLGTFGQGATFSMGGKLGGVMEKQLIGLFGSDIPQVLKLITNITGKTVAESIKMGVAGEEGKLKDISGKTNDLEAIGELFSNSEKGKEYLESIKNTWGDLDHNLGFALQMTLLATAFSGGEIGKTISHYVKKLRSDLPESDVEKFDTITHSLNEEVKQATEKVSEQINPATGMVVEQKDTKVPVTNTTIGTATAKDGSDIITQTKVAISNKNAKGEPLTGEEQDFYNNYKEEIDGLASKVESSNEVKITDEKYKDIPSQKIEYKDGTAFVHKDKEGNKEHLFISRMDVSNKGKGTGSEMLKKVEEHALKIELDQVVTIPETDASRKFFEKNGYTYSDGILTKDLKQKTKKDETKITPIKPVEQGQQNNDGTGLSETPKEEVEGVSGSALKDVESTAKALEGVELSPKQVSEFNDDWVSKRISKEDSFFGSKAKMNVLRATRDDIIASLNSKQQAEIIAIYDAEMQRLKDNPYAKDAAIERVFDRLNEYAPSLKKRFEKQTKGTEPFKEYLNDAIIKIKELKERSEAYHKAKADGSNPELVKAVEDLLGNKIEQNASPQTKEQQQGSDVQSNIAESKGTIQSESEQVQAEKQRADDSNSNVGSKKQEEVTKEEQLTQLVRQHNNIGRKTVEDKELRSVQSNKIKQLAQELGWTLKSRGNGNYDIYDANGKRRRIVNLPELTPEQRKERKEANKESKKWIDRMNTTSFDDITTRVLQYFATGGKVNTKDLHETGFVDKDGKVLDKGEWNRLFPMQAKDAPTIETLIERLLGVLPEDAKYDEAKRAILDVLTNESKASAQAQVMEELYKLDKQDGVEIPENERPEYEKWQKEQAQNELDNAEIAKNDLENLHGIVQNIDNLDLSDSEIKEISEYLSNFKKDNGDIDWDALDNHFKNDFVTISTDLEAKINKIADYVTGEPKEQNTGTVSKDIPEKVSNQQVAEKGIGKTNEQRKAELKQAEAELDKLEKQQDKLQKELEKNLKENQIDLLGGAKVQAMFDDKAELQKAFDQKKAELQAKRVEVAKLQDLVQLDGQAEMDIPQAEIDLVENNQTKVPNGKGSWRAEFNNTNDASRKKDILRAVADISTDINELNDISEAVKGLPKGFQSEVNYAVESKLKSLNKNIPQVEEKVKEPTSYEQAKQRAKELKDKLDAKRKNIGIISDPKQDAEDLFEYHKALVDVAKEFIKEKAGDINAFAKEIGEKVTVAVKTAWDEATGKKIIDKAEDLGYGMDEVDNNNSFSAIKKRVNDELRERLGLPKLTLPKGVGEKEGMKLAKQEYEDGSYDVDALEERLIANKDNTTKVGITEHDQRMLQIKRYDLLSIEKGLNKNQSKIKEKLDADPNNNDLLAEFADNSQRILENIQAIDRNTIASDVAGKISARSLVTRKVELDHEAEIIKNSIGAIKTAYADEIPVDIQQQIDDLTAKHKQLLADIEVIQEKYDTSVKEAEEAIKEAFEKGKKAGKNTKVYTNKAKDIADQFRKLKTKPFTFKDSNGNEIIAQQNSIVSWNDLVEIGAKAIELSGKVADGVTAIIDHISEQDWYRNLSPNDKDSLRAQIEDNLTPKKEKRFKVPKARIKEAIASGIDNIEDLVNEINKDYPDLTPRQVRDAITDYGEVKKMSQEPDDVMLRKIKRAGRVISALEDIANGVRPERSGLQRDKLDPQERADAKKLLHELKKLPLSDEDLSKKLKTAEDAIETRLNNEIDDLQYQIDTGEKAIVNKRNNVTTEEIEKLKAKRDAKREERDKMFPEDKIGDAIQHIKDNATEENTTVITEKMVRNNLVGDLVNAHIETGTPQAEVLQKAFEDLKRILPDITEKQFRDAFLKKGEFQGETKTKTQLQDTLSELKTQENLNRKIDNLEQGITDAIKKQGEKSQKVKDLRKQLAELKKSANNKYPHLSAEQLERQRQTIQSKIDNGNFVKTEVKKEKFQNDLNWIKKNRELQDVKNKFKALELEAYDSAKNTTMKMIDAITNWGRRLLFYGSYAYQLKLGMATVMANIGKLAELPFQAIATNTLRNISSNAPIEGSAMANAKTIPIFYKEMLNPIKFFKGAFEIATSGETQLEKDNKKYKHTNFNWDLRGRKISEILKSFATAEHIPIIDLLTTDGHQILKEPLTRAVYESSVKIQQVFYANKLGIESLNDPAIIATIKNTAYLRALHEKFMGNHITRNGTEKEGFSLTNFIRGSMNKAEQEAIMEGNTAKYAGVGAYKIVNPIVGIPLNILDVVVKGNPVVLLKNIGMAIHANIKVGKGEMSLTHEEADAIIRNLSKGSVTTLWWIAGAMMANSIGGMYSQWLYDKNKIRSGQQIKPGSYKINGNTPTPVQDLFLHGGSHSTQFTSMMMGATFMNVMNKYTKGNEKESFAIALKNATLATAGSIVDQNPVLTGLKGVAKSLENEYQSEKYWEQMSRRYDIPKKTKDLNPIKYYQDKLHGVHTIDDGKEDKSTTPKQQSGYSPLAKPKKNESIFQNMFNKKD